MLHAAQRANLLARVAAMAAASMLGGCYPTLLTSRPKAEIIVTDESGTPLAGAAVTLGIVKRQGVVTQTTLEKFLTDPEGSVRFGRRHDWAVQVLLPHGDVGYLWWLCFSKPGFEAIPLESIEFDEPIKVAMYPSTVPSQCQWQERAGPHVQERDARWIEVGGGDLQKQPGAMRFVDQKIRAAMEASARQQGIELRSWSEYRFQYQRYSNGIGDSRVLVHAICRAPTDFDLSKAFYSEPDDRACFFETTYTIQVYTDQPESAFSPLQVVGGGKLR